MAERGRLILVWLVGMIIFLAGIISIPVVNMISRSEIIKKVLLVNSSESQLYPIWKNPSQLPIYLEVYVFNIVNPFEVLSGRKPVVEQKGPYCYREERIKVDIVHNSNGTVTYKQIKRYHFSRDKSIGPESDTFRTINIPLMTMATFLKWQSWWEDYAISKLIKLFFKSEAMFIERSVNDIVFGYHDEILHKGMELYPSQFYTDFIGILAGKNDTVDGTYTIFTGENNITKLGVIDRYNGTKKLHFWTSDFSNTIYGSDGTVGPPFITKSFTVGMFSTDICRSVFGVFYKDVHNSEGIHLYRFRAPPEAMEKSSVFPLNNGFCTPRGNCMGTGVLNISTCQIVDGFHVPIVVSNPHFYMAEKKYKDAIIGLNPDARLHATDIDIEPNTGLLMHIAKRLQINMYIQAVPDVEQTVNLPATVLPILWINETVTIDEEHMKQVKQELLIPLWIAKVLQCATISVGAVVLIINLLWTAKAYRKGKVKSCESSSLEVGLCDSSEESGTDRLLPNGRSEPALNSGHLDGENQTATGELPSDNPPELMPDETRANATLI